MRAPRDPLAARAIAFAFSLTICCALALHFARSLSLSRREEDETPPHGHITSLAVLRTHRKLGIAAKLMRAAHDAMCGVYDAKYCSLHVRVSNAAAIHLYVDILGYEKKDVEKKYYADGEDAHDMRKTFARLAEEAEKNQDANVDSALVEELKLLSVVG